MTELHVGDRVSIIADEPEYGWQGVLMGDVGQIVKKDPAFNVKIQSYEYIYWVEFSRTPALWKGLNHELTLVSPGAFNKAPPAPSSEQFESDGGSSDYYLLPTHATELRHLISAKSMSKTRGDIFKACYRLGEKAGVDVEYDLNKLEFFIQDLREMYERGEHL